jgi:hypothetical protein
MVGSDVGLLVGWLDGKIVGVDCGFLLGIGVGFDGST